MTINKNETPITLDLKRFEELALKGKTFKNIITDEVFEWNNEITFKTKGITILTTKVN